MQTYQQSPRQDIIPVAGQRIVTRLETDQSTDYLDVQVVGDITIAGGAADLIRNRGSILAIFDQNGVLEAGKEKVNVDGRILRFESEFHSASPLTATRLTSTAAGTYTLREQFRVYFATSTITPRETSYRERDPSKFLEWFVRQVAGGGADRIVKVSGAVTAALTNVKVTVSQLYNAEERQLPAFVPVVEQIEVPIVQVVQSLEVFLKPQHYVRGLTLLQDTAVHGEVNDVLEALILRSDRRTLIGPDMQPVDMLARAMEHNSGGDVYAGPKGALLHFNFAQNGRLANIHNPLEDPNLRFIFKAKPSAVAGAGASSIKIALWMLARDLYVDGRTGRRVVTESLEIPV